MDRDEFVERRDRTSPWRSTHRFGAVRHKWPMTGSPKPFRLAYEIAAGRQYINKKCVRPRINARVCTPSELSPRKYVIGDRRSCILWLSAVERWRVSSLPWNTVEVLENNKFPVFLSRVLLPQEKRFIRILLLFYFYIIYTSLCWFIEKYIKYFQNNFLFALLTCC